MAEWLFEVTRDLVADGRVEVLSARVYETLHPTELVAEYRPSG